MKCWRGMGIRIEDNVVVTRDEADILTSDICKTTAEIEELMAVMKCDIAIVGGGLAGASLAVALAPLGYDIKVIEAVAYKAAEQPSYDDRTLALSHSSCRILSGIGLWEHAGSRCDRHP